MVFLKPMLRNKSKQNNTFVCNSNIYCNNNRLLVNFNLKVLKYC